MNAFPTELTDLIITFIQDEKTLLNCSLVSRSFLSISRPAIFSQIYILSHKYTSSFLSLCDSPLCTIPLARAKFLEVHGDPFGDASEADLERGVLGRLLTWVASDGSGRTLESVLGAQLEELSIKGVHSEELDKAGERNLLVWFRNLTKLEMGFVSFESAKQFSRLVDSFPKLQELSLFNVEVFPKHIVSDDGDADANNANNANDTTDDVFVGRERGPPKGLYELTIANMEPQLLDECIRYGLTLRSFTCIVELSDNEYESSVSLPIIGKILQSAKALVQFTFEVQRSCIEDSWRNYFDIHLAPHVDLSFCPSLRHLEIDVREEWFLIYFLEHISATPDRHHHPSEPPKPTLQTLRVPHLEHILSPTGWSSFDTLLQKPYFSSLRELSFCVVDGFTLEDYTSDVISSSSTMSPSQVPGIAEGNLIIGGKKFLTSKAPRQGTPAHAALTKKMEAAQEKLPRCNERGLLKWPGVILAISY